MGGTQSGPCAFCAALFVATTTTALFFLDHNDTNTVRNDPLGKSPTQERFTMGFWKALLVLALGALPTSDAATKLRRVKAGKHYASHDPVHIVVNKVG